jgi:hypothetical protein
MFLFKCILTFCSEVHKDLCVIACFRLSDATRFIDSVHPILSRNFDFYSLHIYETKIEIFNFSFKRSTIKILIQI